MATKTDWNNPVTITRADDPYAPLRTACESFAHDETLLVFDARMLGYRAYYTRDLSTSSGEPTSILHGVLEVVASTCRAAKTTRYILVNDGSVTYKRKVYPDYKIRHDRPLTPDEVSEHAKRNAAFCVADEGLAMLGVPSVRVPDIEADDAIGLLVTTAMAQRDFRRVVVCSDDKDYYQLIRPAVYCWRAIKGELVGVSAFRRMFGFGPEKYVHWKALVGEPSGGDNIPGVAGIGEKTATKMVRQFGDIESIIAAAITATTRPKARAIDRAIVMHQHDARMSLVLSTILTHESHTGQRVCSTGWDKQRAMSLISDAIREAKSKRRLSRHDLLSFKGRYEFDAWDHLDWAAATGVRL